MHRQEGLNGKQWLKWLGTMHFCVNYDVKNYDEIHVCIYIENYITKFVVIEIEISLTKITLSER